MKTHIVTLFIGVIAFLGIVYMAVPAESVETSNDRLHVTQYLAWKMIPPNDYMLLFDTSPDTIAGGHIAIKADCDKNGDALVDVLMGVAEKEMHTVKLTEHNMLPGLSAPGEMCLYHIDLPAEHDMIVTDLAIYNPSDERIRFGLTSTVTIYVNAFGDPLEHEEEHGEEDESTE